MHPHHTRATQPASPAGLLQFEDVWVVYAAHTGPREALRGVSFALQSGEWLAVVGHNGSGKSTIGHVLANLCDVSKGKVLWHAAASERVRLVFQNPDSQALGETVWEDVTYQPAMAREQAEQDTQHAAQSALDRVGLLERRWQTVASLSGGQKQRLAIAAAVTADPDVIVFDEATSMLDPTNRRKVLQTAHALHDQGVTVVWITQRMDELYMADRVLLVAGGEISFSGEPRALFYPAEDGGHSPCELAGFQPPYAVAVARGLQRRGLKLAAPLPLTAADLERSLETLCRS